MLHKLQFISSLYLQSNIFWCVLGFAYHICIGGVRKEGQIQTQNMGQFKFFAAKILFMPHVCYPKIWMVIFFRNMVHHKLNSDFWNVSNLIIILSQSYKIDNKKLF